MGAISVRLPDDLKEKAMKLAKKKKMSFNSLINHWLQAAVTQDETLEWMKRQLSGKDPEQLIRDFGSFLEQSTPGDEPSLDEIESAME
ncbi:MAG: hypothetical protein KDH97_02975 [Calditrichaeota bacterium]|nr:hypothetical protein [Calditrichota bacterium]MCB0304997.1 hypothetical protein [Calditrichota bacterium]